jgi:class 3 adenylate cyclase/tetratricopeptide (TPR) repeat protein
MLEARILEERTSIEGERKQVTVMYADIVGSMELTRALQAERWGFVLDRFLAIAADAVHRFEGTVNQFTGDGLLAVFGAPIAHEDHARRACLAVLELQREVAVLANEVERRDGATFAIRCGLNSGEVVVGAIGDDVHMDFVPLGNTTALGKRIESLARAGSTAISASTAALVEGQFETRELGEFEVKGVEEPQRVIELVGPGTARTRLQAVAATRGLTPFVGRDAERGELESALERALAGDGSAIGIAGEAGVGKSRLVHEFVTACHARGVPVTSAAGVSHGRYVPLLAVLALYRDHFGIGALDAPTAARERIETTLLGLGPGFADDLPLLFDFLGVPDPSRPLGRVMASERRRRLLALITQMLRARSGRDSATVLVIEDLHWIDDASAAFVEALADAVAGTRTVLVATYRPEHEAAWAHAQIGLGPLGAEATGDLLTQLLGRDASLDGLATLIRARARGNPFFVEEIVQALAESGRLAGARGAHRLAAELDDVVLPATVQAGLAARIDRLPAREKTLVQTMSVVGTEIPAPLLGAVSGLGTGELAGCVDALERARWIVADDASGSREYAFRHPLTREVAYSSQLSERRARTHRAVADAIERTYADRLDERAALLAHHCEAAGDALATKARLGMLSMIWRLGLSPDETAAIRAEAREDAGQVVVDLHAAGSLLHSGHEPEGLEGFRRASRRSVAMGNAGHVLTASTGVAYASWIAGSLRESLETLDHALAMAGEDPDVGSGAAFVCPLAQAHKDRAQCLAYMGGIEAARSESAHAIGLAREHDDPETESAAHASRALVEAEIGEVEAALDHAALGLAIAERAGNLIHVIACSAPAAIADVRSGRFADALARAQADLATIREHRVGLYFEPLLLATVARAQLALGAPAEALAVSEEAVGIATARGLATCALQAPLALAEVLTATGGPAADARIELVLAEAMRVARESGARAFEPWIQRERAMSGRIA